MFFLCIFLNSTIVFYIFSGGNCEEQRLAYIPQTIMSHVYHVNHIHYKQQIKIRVFLLFQSFQV
ncbi:unnamed protein product [Tenebrio molitor]|nr:unnamed protein product [Tenebrio molitor]